MSLSALDKYGRRRLAQVSATLFLIVGVYFTAAGRLNLPWGWAYLGVSLLSLLIGGAYVLRRNPQAINERGRPAENQKTWDKILVALMTPLYFLVYIFAGLDARFAWTGEIPLGVHWTGVALTILSAALTYSAMAHNPFLAQAAQIAEGRGHRVATEGPYRVVRHPMYVSLVVGWLGVALLLGSYWALIPAALASLLIIIRTALEDQMLIVELPGYKEYAQKTRYRLLPGIW